jgi:upstream activation factor subunit UAF30
MPKQTTKTTAPKTAEVTETVAATAPVAAAAAEKPKRVAKAAAPKAAAPAPAAAPVKEEPVVAADAAATESEVDTGALATEFVGKLNALSAMINSLKSEFRSLQKKYEREVKTAQKTSSKNKRKTGNRKPSGFVKPTKISDELATFLGKEKGVEMARTDVTREITAYIRGHNLQDKENGRKINPDAKLASLLKIKKNEELTYFNLQRYMSPHFSKAAKAATSA